MAARSDMIDVMGFAALYPSYGHSLDTAPYWPFQTGVRLLRKASMPSRKSSLI